MTEKFREEVFHWHYGSSPLVVSSIWYDMQQGGYLSFKQNSLKGFKMYMASHFFLWVYPKNAGLTATRFRMCVKYCKGQHLWEWIRKFTALAEETIKWDESLASKNKSDFVASVDCTDCKTWEPRAHFHYNIDKSFFSKKTESGSGRVKGLS